MHCTNCGNLNPPGVSFCPRCGSSQRQLEPQAPRSAWHEVSAKRLQGGIFLAVAVAIVGTIIAVNALTNEPTSPNSSVSLSENRQEDVKPSIATVAASKIVLSPPIHMNQQFKVGYWTYTVHSYQWQSFLGTGYSVERPDAMFLVVELVARNDDRTESTLPPVKLVNDQQQEFSESSAGSLVTGFFGPLKQLNPGVSSSGLIAFDVPRGKYTVRLSGGFTSGKSADVDLEESDGSAQTIAPYAEASPDRAVSAPPSENSSVAPGSTQNRSDDSQDSTGNVDDSLEAQRKAGSVQDSPPVVRNGHVVKPESGLPATAVRSK